MTNAEYGIESPPHDLSSGLISIQIGHYVGRLLQHLALLDVDVLVVLPPAKHTLQTPDEELLAGFDQVGDHPCFELAHPDAKELTLE